MSSALPQWPGYRAMTEIDEASLSTNFSIYGSGMCLPDKCPGFPFAVSRGTRKQTDGRVVYDMDLDDCRNLMRKNHCGRYMERLTRKRKQVLVFSDTPIRHGVEPVNITARCGMPPHRKPPAHLLIREDQAGSQQENTRAGPGPLGGPVHEDSA